MMFRIRMCPECVALCHRGGILHHFDNANGLPFAIVLVLDEHGTIALIEGIVSRIVEIP